MEAFSNLFLEILRKASKLSLPATYLKDLLDRIRGNLVHHAEIELENVHFRFEDHLSVCEKVCCEICLTESTINRPLMVFSPRVLL